ncbi:MAG: hypothetical protein AAF149_23585 [Bacteroidota bacterium]
MKKALLVMISIFAYNLSFAQEQNSFKFRDKSDEMTTEVPEYVSKHYLGNPFTEKFYVLKEQYVWKPLESSGTPNPVPVTEKPSIYNSLKKLDRYYKKQLKKGNLSEDEVRENLEKALAVCYSVRHQETKDLEKVLWKTKDINEIEKIFTEQIALN